MAYNEFLADRIRTYLSEKKMNFEEKKMMGGLTFMVNEKMCVGIVKEDLMARINPDIEEEALSKKGCRQMDFTGKPMKGYVFVNPEGVDQSADLEYFLSLALEFNKIAKASKSRKKK